MTTRPTLAPFRLKVQFAERVWGKLDLRPWYEQQFSKPVGEAWLTGGDCVVETGEHAGSTFAQLQQEFPEQLLGEGPSGDGFPLLVKMLFPEDKLSVQVHPDDDDAAALGGEARAKTECWYVLEAEPGATVSLGLAAGTTEAQTRQALGDVSFEQLLHEEPAAAGDMIYVEAGTVHAIGPGLVLLEVQQTSDTTYRLYDYGRPRELHLEAGMKVVKLQTNSGKRQARPIPHGSRLIAEKHFTVDRFDLAPGSVYGASAAGRPECVIGLRGEGVLVAGDAELQLLVGQAVVIPVGTAGFRVEGPCSFVRCMTAAATS